MKIRILCFTIFLFCCSFSASKGQSDSTISSNPKLEISGFADVFYGFDFNHPTTNFRLPFLYNHNRHNEFNLNLAFIKLAVGHPIYRANLALQAGTYANDNYANEPGLLKNIFEANVGIALNRKNNLWLDAGIFASHIGFESAISMDNWTLTRSLLADNSPYYLSGAKITFNPFQKAEWAFLVCNGWQRIQKVKGSSLPSCGTQIKISPSQSLSLNWSTFIGTDDPDSSRRMRYFSNLYGQWTITKRLGLISGFDIGTQQKSKNSKNYNLWFSPVIIAKLAISDQWSMAIRAEYYQDENAVLIRTPQPGGFKTSGYSINFDYSPAKNFVARIETKWLQSEARIFERNLSPTNDNFFLVGSMAVKLD